MPIFVGALVWPNMLIRPKSALRWVNRVPPACVAGLRWDVFAPVSNAWSHNAGWRPAALNWVPINSAAINLRNLWPLLDLDAWWPGRRRWLAWLGGRVADAMLRRLIISVSRFCANYCLQMSPRNARGVVSAIWLLRSMWYRYCHEIDKLAR